MSSFAISRRLFLGGVGAALGLPLLDAVAPSGRRARAAGATPPRRLVFFIVSYGHPEYTVPGCFRPADAGANYTLTRCLEPLAALKGDVSILSGLQNWIAFAPPGYDMNDHPSLCQAILTGVSPMNPAARSTAAISVDQVAANYLKTFTPGLPSLEIGTHVEGYVTDNFSWRDETTPLSRLVEPLDAFNRVFAGDDPAATQAMLERRKRRRLRILDYAKADLDRLQRKLGTADRERLDQYLTSVGQLEDRVANQTVSQCATASPPGAYGDIQEHATALLDLIPLAFQCDRTRVVTFTLEANSDNAFPFLPAGYQTFKHHADLSHAGQDPQKLQGYVELTRWKVSMFAHLVDRLKQTPEADGTGSLLDNTAVVFLSEMGYGDGHIPGTLPVILAGKGGGAFHPGRHLVFGDENPYNTASPPVTNLYLNLLSSIGLDVPRFGNSVGPIADL
jgi:hypothetical protein